MSLKFASCRPWIALLPLAGGALSCLQESTPSLPSSDPAPKTSEFHSTTAVNSSLRLVSFPPGVRSKVIEDLELESLVSPWRSQRTGNLMWVLSVDSKLEQALRSEGLGVEPFERPEEYETWGDDYQVAWNYIAKDCMLNSGDTTSAFPVSNRIQPSGAPVSPYTVSSQTPYEGYYLPYFQDINGAYSLETRSLFFQSAITSGQSINGLQLPTDFFGGYPWDSNAPTTNVGPGYYMPMLYFELGWKTAGTFQGRPHQGPKSLLFIGANQHPREMITFEVAWRLMQRLVHSYGKGRDLSSPYATNTFWQKAFDDGLHVLIIPTINPWGYEEMTRNGGYWNTEPTQGDWPRTNVNRVDLNRNWPVHWLQGGTDGREGWGTGAGGGFSGYNADNLLAAGRKPSSEPEVTAVLSILQAAIGRLSPNVSIAQAQRRFPVAGIDLHASAGMVMKSTYTSPYGYTSGDEAYLCGITSDCISPDEPVQSAIFGNNNRPGLMGRTGLALGGNSSTQDDPDLPYYHGRNNANIYSSSGKITTTLASRRWYINGVTRGMPAASVELTANRSGNAFGFGTCAPPSKATQAIDQVVLDVIPTVERMAQGVLSPAELPEKGTELMLPPITPNQRGPLTPTPYPTTASIVNLGVRYEASAEAKTWRVANMYPCNDTNDEYCHSGPCNAGSGDLCSGTWWSSYSVSGTTNARSLRKYWMFAVRLPNPSSSLPEESTATDVQAHLTSCMATATATCPLGTSVVLLRRGSYYNLYGIPLGLDQEPPQRVTIRRRVTAGTIFTDRESGNFVASTIPSSSALLPSMDPMAPGVTNELMLSSLLQTGERMREVRVDFAVNQDYRSSSSVVLAATWPYYATNPPGRRLIRLEPTQLDAGARQAANATNASWVNGGTTSPGEANHIYTYDFDLIRAVWEQSQGQFDTDGTAIALSWYSGISNVNIRPPVVSAQVFSPRGFSSLAVESPEASEEPRSVAQDSQQEASP